MGKVLALAFGAVLTLQAQAGRDARVALPPQVTEAEMAAAVITLSQQSNGNFSYEDPRDLRNGAVFTVGVYGDGTVTYIGSSGVGMIGTLTHKIPSDTARALVEEFLGAGFFGFEDSYRDIYYGGLTRTSRTHQSGTILSLSVGGRTKSIYAELGVPYKLRQLERRVEEATDVRRYTGKPSRPVGPHVLSGRALDNNAAPIAGVSITLAGDIFYTATTDADGAYRISGVSPGNYTLIATGAGLVNAVSKREVQVEAAPPNWNPVLVRHEGPAELLDLLSQLNLAVGQTPKDCGQYLLPENDGKEANTATLERFLECVTVSRKSDGSFRVVVQQKDSRLWIAHGVAGGPNRSQFFFTFYGSSCPGPNCPGRLVSRLCARVEVRPDADGRAQIICG